MKKGKLYIKIFLSFLILLIISEVLIFGIFHLLRDRTIHDEIMGNLKRTISIFKDIIEEKLEGHKTSRNIENTEIGKFIRRVQKEFRLDVWIETPDKRMISFSKKDMPDLSDTEFKDWGKLQFKFKRTGKKPFAFVKMPIMFPGDKQGNIYLYHRLKDHFPAGRFLIGLGIIGFALALLLYPFSRFITTPLKRLTETANKISKGDLSRRVEVKSKDEIGQLADSFNAMAETLEAMIKNTRDLTANISHELRSPLTRIRVAQELLAKKISRETGTRAEAGTDVHEVKKLLETIENEIEEMDNLIGQVLILAKLDIKDQVFQQKEDVDIIETVLAVLEKFNQAFEGKGITVAINTAPVPKIKTYRDDIKTAISNIIDNALKYTEPGGNVNIDIRDMNDNVLLSFTNTHKGLGDNDLKNIFNPFYRIKADALAAASTAITTETAQNGSGLGLTITKKIIENHGGKIDAGYGGNELTIKIILPIHP